jgi:hypothetical protein
MSEAKTLGEALCKHFGWEHVLRIEIDLAVGSELIRVTFAADDPLGGVFQTVKTFQVVQKP